MAKENTTPTKEPDQVKTHHLLPTPPVGWPVQYFIPGDVTQSSPIAATVTGIEGPGRLELIVFGPRKMPSHKQAVYHITEEKIMSGAWKNKPTWDYLEGMTNKMPFAYHKGLLEKADKLREQQMVRQKEIEENYQRRLAELRRENNDDPIIPEAR